MDWPLAYSVFNMHRIVFDHLVDMFPVPGGVEVTGKTGRSEGKHSFVNGALGGTGEYLF